MSRKDGEGGNGHVAEELLGHGAAHMVSHAVGHFVGASNAVSAAASGLFGFQNCMPADEFSKDQRKKTEEYLKRKYGENPDGTAKRPWQPNSSSS